MDGANSSRNRAQPGDQPGPDAAPVEEAGAPEPQGPQQGPPPPVRYAPTTVSLPAGTWVTMRLNEPLSSDHNIAGDAFTGTLLEPIVANGLLIARRGATVTGVVSEAKKAGRVSGVSHLGIELTEIQLADGRQVQVKTRLMERRGNTSYGRDAAAIGTTTASRRRDRRWREWRCGRGSRRGSGLGGFHHWRVGHAWTSNGGLS